MRILVVDNYDSFTFNIVQYLAEITGTRPLVIKNDETTWDVLRNERFSAFVISPGPGHPARSRDFGLGSAILLQSEVPVLGICLGHQGLANVFGGQVGRAPEPVHGRVSLVRHNSQGLFKDIPSPFRAVRYHSLIARHPLPDVLRITATTEPNLIMGIEHRERPLYGVQFHPESIQTEFGKLLLNNFVEIARSRDEHTGVRSFFMSPSPSPRPRLGKWRVLHRKLRVGAEPPAVFPWIFGRTTPSFWLDSSLVKPGLSRFSFMGDVSGPAAFVLRYSLAHGATLTSSSGATQQQGPLLPLLRKTLDLDVDGTDELPFEFCGGLVGYFGYELRDFSGIVNRRQSTLPDATWLFVDRFLAFDHHLREWYLVSVQPSCSPEETSYHWFDEVASLLHSTPPRPAWHPSRVRQVPFALESDRAEYLRQIAAAKVAISEGETYEVCLTNRLRTAAADVDSLALYMVLRTINPAPYAAYLNLGDFAVLCSSPERFLKLSANGVVESKPIKGTRRRVADPCADAMLASDLARSEKDCAENLMITDLVRNDLSRVCELGSVWVPKLMHVESYETVHQLVTTIRGHLRTGHDALDLVRAAFPPGSMTGAPKARTLEIIDTLEQSPRGIYSGALGYLSLSGAADLNVVIRTIVQTERLLEIGIGGAIVALSDPEDEFEEILVKAKAPCMAISVAHGAEPPQLSAEHRPVAKIADEGSTPDERATVVPPAASLISPLSEGAGICMRQVRYDAIAVPLPRKSEGQQVAEALLFAEQHGLPCDFNIAGWIVNHLARRHFQQIALIDDRKCVTYEQLAHAVRRTASRLAATGVTPKQRVALVASDSLESVVTLLAIVYVGATAVIIGPHSRNGNMCALLEECRADHMAIDEASRTTFAAGAYVTASDAVTERGWPASCTLVDELSDNHLKCETMAAVPASPFDPAFGLYKSGVNNAKRLVVHCHQDPVVSAVRYAAQVLDMSANDVVLSTCHTSSFYGLQSLFIALLHGASAVLRPQLESAKTLVDTILRNDPTIIFAVPATYRSLLKDETQRRRLQLRRLRFCISGREHLTEELRREWHTQYGCHLLDSVGSTETLSTYISELPGVCRPVASGKLVPGFNAMLRNETGRVCRTGERGLLWIRGPSIALRDDGGPRASKGLFLDGWFCTGDYFTCDAEGYFYFCGHREKNPKTSTPECVA